MNGTITETIQHALKQYHLPGLAVAVIKRDDEVFAGGCGHFDPACRRAIDAETPFGVASLTKLVTTMLVMLLNEQRRLSVDDRLAKYFPALDIARTTPIRLRHLLSHSAGFPGLPGRFYARNIVEIGDRSGGLGEAPHESAIDTPNTESETPSILNATELVELINRLEFSSLGRPGERLNYSNEGFCLLGGVIEQVTQRPYAALAREMIFAPLRMNQSTVGGVGFQASDKVALPLLRDGDGYRLGKFWHAPLFYPAGGMISSVRDIARLISALADKPGLLSAASRQQMMQPGVAVPSRPVPGIGYGFGLEYQKIDRHTTMIWHSGQRAGISSFMGWLVEEQMAVSVLCNVAGAPVTRIAHQLIGKLLNRADIIWPPVSLASDPQTTALEGLAGCYESNEGNRYVVERINGDLMLCRQSGSAPEALRFSRPDSGIAGDQTFRFLGAGRQVVPWALALDLRVLPRRGFSTARE